MPLQRRALGAARLFAPALVLAAAALVIHVAATVGEWASLRYQAWGAEREWIAIAADAGVTPDAAATPAAARVALARRYASLRHSQGLPAPDDALPLLARATPALAALPAGAVKSASYADGHWTLDLAPPDATTIADLDDRLRVAGVPALVAIVGHRDSRPVRRAVMATSFDSLRVPAPVASWLATKSPAERRIAATVLLLVVIALLWTALWQPLTRDVAALRIAQAGSDATLVDARRMVKEIGGLARTPPMDAPSDARAALERILLQQNLRAAVTQLEWRDGRAHVVLAAVDYQALIGALEALQREAGLRSVEATLTARVEPGTVRADFTLAR